MIVSNVRLGLFSCSRSTCSLNLSDVVPIIRRCAMKQWASSNTNRFQKSNVIIDRPCLIVRPQSNIKTREISGRLRRPMTTRKLTQEIAPGKPDINGIRISKLQKSFIFAVGFSCCSFVGCAVWQYENFRQFAKSAWKNQSSTLFQNRWTHSRPSSSMAPIQMIKGWWDRLTEGQKVAMGIISLNGLVFLAWRVPALQPFMIKWFTSSPAAKAICWPMVLSTFSHYSFWHFGVNMYVLYSFSTGIVATLGKEQFMAMYLTGGVLSSFASYLHKVITVRPGISLGASGSLMAVLGFFCTQYPTAQLSIVFLPMFTFTADMALKGILLMDGLGVLMGWKFFDHAAHLGGVLFGIIYAKWGREYVWAKREPIVRLWNQIRGKPIK